MRAWMIVAAVAMVSGCGTGSGLGSLNPFGRGSAERVERDPAGAERIVADASVLSPNISRVTPEPALRGMILRVQAIAPAQGYHSPKLVARDRGRPDKNGIVTYELRVVAPRVAGGPGPAQTRQLTAATFIADAQLGNIRGFRIVGQNNVVNLTR